MPTVVPHKETGETYVLLGAGYGAYRSSRPGAVFGSLGPVEESGEVRAVLVCGVDGLLGWLKSSVLEAVTVDGQTPSEILGDAGFRRP